MACVPLHRDPGARLACESPIVIFVVVFAVIAGVVAIVVCAIVVDLVLIVVLVSVLGIPLVEVCDQRGVHITGGRVPGERCLAVSSSA
jgi:hypothetical protein